MFHLWHVLTGKYQVIIHGKSGDSGDSDGLNVLSFESPWSSAPTTDQLCPGAA